MVWFNVITWFKLEDDVVQHVLLESRCFKLDRIVTNRHVRETIIPIFVGVGRVRDPGRFIGHVHGGAGNHRSTGIGDLAEDAATRALGVGKGSEKGEKRDEEEERARELPQSCINSLPTMGD